MIIDPVVVPSVSPELKATVDQINRKISQLNAYTKDIDSNVENLNNISMESTVLVIAKTSTGRDFVTDHLGELVGAP